MKAFVVTGKTRLGIEFLQVSRTIVDAYHYIDDNQLPNDSWHIKTVEINDSEGDLKETYMKLNSRQLSMTDTVSSILHGNAITKDTENMSLQIGKKVIEGSE